MKLGTNRAYKHNCTFSFPKIKETKRRKGKKSIVWVGGFVALLSKYSEVHWDGPSSVIAEEVNYHFRTE